MRTLTCMMVAVALVLLMAAVDVSARRSSPTPPVRGHFVPPSGAPRPHHRPHREHAPPPLEEREATMEQLFVHQMGVNDPKATSSKDCIMCTFVLSLMEQYALASRQNLTSAAQSWCRDVTKAVPFLDSTCASFLTDIVQGAQRDFERMVSPDVTCRTTLGKCNGADAMCTLHPSWPPAPHSLNSPRLGVQRGMSSLDQHVHYASTVARFLNVRSLSEEMIATKLRDLKKAGMLPKNLEALQGEWQPVPIPDWDSDKYASSFTYRGVQWRGKDCDDGNSKIYPGRNAFQGDYDAQKDTNCNGISGVDTRSGIPWERALCERTPSRGLLAIGDSATAHFALPPSFIIPAGFNASTYEKLIDVLITEADFPQCSWSTAWASKDECPHSLLNVTSIYQKMLERNRCMHRDYVNAGVNGASVRNLIKDDGYGMHPSNYSGQMLAYPDRFKVDGPSTVFFSMIGNDICGSTASYTPVDEFLKKAQAEFAYLDTVLAKGSHVIIMGIVDGRVLFNTLRNAMHPIGTPYTSFYDYLNCLHTSPCSGWMNSNESIRNASSAHAALLNQQYQTIIQSNRYKNFDLHYFYPDYADVINKWVAQGHDAADLIEAVDGFHPSQTGNMLLAAAMWEWLGDNVPEAMGQVNPNNADIVRLFGNQGGHV